MIIMISSVTCRAAVARYLTDAWILSGTHQILLGYTPY